MAQIQQILLSAIICDRVIFDKMSGAASLIDIMQTINAPQYPLRYGRLVFYCELTNGHGDTETKIKLIDLDEDEKVIFEQQGQIKFKDVQQVITLAVNLQGLVFPHPGEYRFQLLTSGQLLGERRIVCRRIKLPPKTKRQ